jgi:predicted MPP superfamily phosphohydrolase
LRLLALAFVMLFVPSRSRAEITGVVFDDKNSDGLQQPGESGLPDIAVSNQIDVVQTDAAGAYRLSGRGTGVVFVSLPRGRVAVSNFWRSAPSDDAAGLHFPLAATTDADDFTFIHASDTHLSEQSLPRTRLLLGAIEVMKPDLVLVSGDLIRDALRVNEAEATRLYEMYVEEMATSARPVWSVPGNHEIFGIERHHSLVSAGHPLFGKAMYRKHLGPNYYSFNRGKIHFIALDTVDIEDLWYYGHLDKAQLEWLEQDLKTVPKGATVVTFNHIPFFSAGLSVAGYTDGGVAPSLIRAGDKTSYRHVVANTADLLSRLKDHRYTLSLSGHNHAFERLSLSPDKDATRFHLAAAVIGPRTGMAPSPSGVTLYRVRGGTIDDGEFIPLDQPAPPK